MRLGHLRGYIPEQPDLIDFLTFGLKKWSSLDLGINKLTKPLPRCSITGPTLIYTSARITALLQLLSKRIKRYSVIGTRYTHAVPFYLSSLRGRDGYRLHTPDDQEYLQPPIPLINRQIDHPRRFYLTLSLSITLYTEWSLNASGGSSSSSITSSINRRNVDSSIYTEPDRRAAIFWPLFCSQALHRYKKLQPK